MLARIAIAVPLGAFMTGALLYAMYALIATGQGNPEVRVFRDVDFVRVEREEHVLQPATRPEKPEPIEPAPELPRPEASEAFGVNIEVASAKADIHFGLDIGGTGLVASDGEYLPIVKVAPVYPMRALQRRLEGYVIVEFVVTASGAVRDITVVESSDAVFEQAAIDAATKFRYKPRVVDGQSIEVAGVQNRITFRLDA